MPVTSTSTKFLEKREVEKSRVERMTGGDVTIMLQAHSNLQLLKKSPTGNVLGKEQLTIDRVCNIGKCAQGAAPTAEECRFMNSTER
jgi:hypothetical protein